VLPSAPGYSLAVAGNYIDSGEGFVSGPGYAPTLDGLRASTSANFAGDGALQVFTASYDGGEGVTAGSVTGVSAGALSDGVIGWGRWSSGTEYTEGWGASGLHNTHYVIGIPTPEVDMNALVAANAKGTYSLTGFTFPTAYDYSTGVTIVGTQPISASLIALFGSYSVSGNLSVPIGGSTYASSWSGSINTSNFNGSGASLSIQGFFAGANASRAGLVYQFGGTAIGDISGAAAFKQTGLCVVGTGC